MWAFGFGNDWLYRSKFCKDKPNIHQIVCRTYTLSKEPTVNAYQCKENIFPSTNWEASSPWKMGIDGKLHNFQKYLCKSRDFMDFVCFHSKITLWNYVYTKHVFIMCRNMDTCHLGKWCDVPLESTFLSGHLLSSWVVTTIYWAGTIHDYKQQFIEFNEIYVHLHVHLTFHGFLLLEVIMTATFSPRL